MPKRGSMHAAVKEPSAFLSKRRAERTRLVEV
jgi:hypothetical protein